MSGNSMWGQRAPGCWTLRVACIPVLLKADWYVLGSWSNNSRCQISPLLGFVASRK
jgi:hypothetical protein